MRIVNPNVGKDLLKKINDYKKLEVAVGLPKGKRLKKYKTVKTVKTVLDVGLVHEYGSISRNIPQRSFLRTPFLVKDKEIRKEITRQAINVFDKKETVKSGLSKIGIFATGISQMAFTSRGYGNWKPLAEETIRRKKKKASKRRGKSLKTMESSTELIDTGILRSSITYAVRMSK
jgi:hypothetical protein